MGVGIAIVVDRSGKIHEMADVTSSHDRIILTEGLRDGLGDLARMYLLPPRPQDYFDADAYKLYMRGARFQRYGVEAMRETSNIERPAWLDDDKWFEIEDRMIARLRSKLAARPIIVTEYLDMRGVKDRRDLPLMTVMHCVNIEDSTIERFHPGTEIYGDLQAARSALTPEGLEGVKIGTNRGTLWIEGLKQMTYLPESLTVNGNELQVYMTDIRKPVQGRIMAAGSGLTWDGVPDHLKGAMYGL